MKNSQIVLTIISFIFWINGTHAGNLTCYQCTTNSYAPCPANKLLPCPEISDRCVTHISKDAEKGLTVKRECGLGPCGFDDVMVNKGLGFGNCDMSRNEFFCISCCRESGCNNGCSRISSQLFISVIVLVTVCHIFLNYNMFMKI